MAGFLIAADAGELRERARRLAGDEGADEVIARYRRQGVAGTPEEVVERLRAYEEAGVVRVMLQHLLHDDLDAPALVGADVLPRLVHT